MMPSSLYYHHPSVQEQNNSGETSMKVTVSRSSIKSIEHTRSASTPPSLPLDSEVESEGASCSKALVVIDLTNEHEGGEAPPITIPSLRARSETKQQQRSDRDDDTRNAKRARKSRYTIEELPDDYDETNNGGAIEVAKGVISRKEEEEEEGLNEGVVWEPLCEVKASKCGVCTLHTKVPTLQVFCHQCTTKKSEWDLELKLWRLNVLKSNPQYARKKFEDLFAAPKSAKKVTLEKLIHDDILEANQVFYIDEPGQYDKFYCIKERGDIFDPHNWGEHDTSERASDEGEIKGPIIARGFNWWSSAIARMGYKGSNIVPTPFNVTFLFYIPGITDKLLALNFETLKNLCFKRPSLKHSSSVARFLKKKRGWLYQQYMRWKNEPEEERPPMIPIKHLELWKTTSKLENKGE